MPKEPHGIQCRHFNQRHAYELNQIKMSHMVCVTKKDLHTLVQLFICFTSKIFQLLHTQMRMRMPWRICPTV